MSSYFNPLLLALSIVILKSLMGKSCISVLKLTFLKNDEAELFLGFKYLYSLSSNHMLMLFAHLSTGDIF